MVTRPAKLNDPEKVQELVNSYFSEREEQMEIRELKNGDVRVYKTPPTMIGLAAKLGVSRRTLQEYMNSGSEEEHDSYDKQILPILRDAKERIINELIDGVSKGYWTEKIVLAMLTRYGEIGNDEEDKTVHVVIQGNSDWSK